MTALSAGARINGISTTGKSTLCKAFLGEVPYVKGIVKISSGADVGFCDQTPYLTNTTIYENIIGQSVVDDAWYMSVIRAVDLETDFERFSSGDRTLVGNNGDALSAGQKQRVALARAVRPIRQEEPERREASSLSEIDDAPDTMHTKQERIAQLRPLDLELKSPLYTHFLDTLRGITTVRAFGWSQQYVERNQQLLDASQRPNYLLQMIQQWLSLVLNMVVVVIVTLLVTLSLKLRSSLGLTAVALVNLMSLSQMLRSVVIGWTLMETSITAVSRIKEFEQTTPRENDLNSEGAITHGPVSGKIEYKNLTVSYGPRNENLALKNVNLVIEAGQKVGICGRIGSINAIPQDPFVTSGTFREVLDPYETSPDHTIEEALRKVKLFEHVLSHGGLSDNVKPESLSQGQKQLLSLARAILRRCRIVVLDEVTSRLETIVGFDRVAVMDEGNIIEFDDPRVLLEDTNSAFSKLRRMGEGH
ncbi:ABC multidrug transporter [Colletotrichum kahawae]|uniref:ABC multidrug transporter n=1 Tax=Colletotrichum kahawae TaxID=34407 RepID=A0AAD9Y6H1_COLKA|nr:ABC multidrug transporter [Colletotrichum kahawae]